MSGNFKFRMTLTYEFEVPKSAYLDNDGEVAAAAELGYLKESPTDYINNIGSLITKTDHKVEVIES